MGLLRYFLALVVIFCHAGQNNMLKPLEGNGGLAVQAFFVISGFYMALIFEKYQLESSSFLRIKNFYLSRLLRIYPIYYLSLALMLVLYHFKIFPLFAHPPATVLHDLLASFTQKALYLFENFFIFGQSLLRFFIYDPNVRGFVFHPLNNMYPDDFLGSSFTILGQSWSLSLELTFYLLVPFLLNKSNKFILILIVLSFSLRSLLQCMDYYSSQVMHAFFPLELGVFLLGVVSYRYIYLKIQHKSADYFKKYALSLLSFIFIYSFFIYHLIENYTLKYWLFVLLTMISIPYLFCYTKNSKFDRYIGELSYPVYMTHFICIALIMKLPPSPYEAFYVIALSTGMSILFAYLVARPVDYFRHRKFLDNNPAPFLENKQSSPQGTAVLDSV